MACLKITNTEVVENAIRYHVYENLEYLRRSRKELVEKSREYIKTEFYMQFVEGILSNVKLIDAQIEVLEDLTEALKGNVEIKEMV